MAGEGALGGARARPAVLLVNDRSADRVAIGAMLASLNVAVVEADSGRGALRAFLRQSFALILMDVRMPGMDGYETANLIRQRHEARQTPIIFLTACGREDDRQSLVAYASGAIDFIYTPVVREVLRAKVSAFVDLYLQSEALHRSLDSITALNVALSDSEASTQAVLDNVADGIVSVDAEGLIESINQSAQVLFGYHEAEVIGEPLTTLIAPERRAEFRGSPHGPPGLMTLHLTAAAAVAWKTQQACSAEFTLDDAPVQVSASVGIALFFEHGTTTDELLRRADAAMYVAKRSGSGHAVFDATQETQAARQLALLADLRQCIERDELVLHYQPKLHLASREIFGVEALIRWQHPEQGLLAPDRFMPEVERTELIGPVTSWVLGEALRQQSIWRDDGVDLTMAVNISAHSLRADSRLPDIVGQLTDTWGSPPDRLTLELTEGALIESAAPDILDRLHTMGEKMSIDDYGIGYSSLAYLQRLPVDELKIDRSFITNLSAQSDDAVIVRSTIDLAHNLGLSVVAEGVEDNTAMNLLATYGCDSVQGYLLGRPCPAPELTARLRGSVRRGSR